MDIIDLVKDMVHAPASSVLPSTAGWSDVVEGTREQRQVYREAMRRDLYNYIRRRLGHIVVNPHSRDNTKALNECYVYAEDELLDSQYVNRSEKSTKVWLETLIERARQARDGLYYRGELDATDATTAATRYFHMILHGRRGAGKTFFLNHVLSRYSSLFDNERILWIRLNLVEAFEGDLEHDFQYNLVERVYAQTAKIVFRYYDPKSALYSGKPFPLDLTPELFAYARATAPDKDTRVSINRSVMALHQMFGTRGIDEPLRPGLVDDLVGQKILELIRDKGYSIICVLDGLDRLEASTHHGRRFEGVFEAAVKLTTSSGNMGMMVLSVTRTNTLNTLPDISSQATPYSVDQIDVNEIFPVGLERVLTRRIEFLQSHIGDLADSQSWDLTGWPRHLDEFVDFLRTSAGGMPSSMLDMFADNRRAQMQVVQLRYFDFLRATEGRSYQFIESLALAGQSFPPRPYRYEVVTQGSTRWRTHVNTKTSFDNHLLPSLFDFPYIDWSDRRPDLEVPKPHSQGILWSIRCLQFVAAADLIVQRDPEAFDQTTPKEVAGVLSRLFGYELNLTHLLISQLSENECVLPLGGDFKVYRDSSRVPLQLMPKGWYILNEFLFDIAYLHLCAMRVPISLERRDNCRYFVPASLDVHLGTDDSGDGRLSNWIAAKVINACGLTRMVVDANRLQRKMCQENIARLNARERRIIEAAERSRHLRGSRVRHGMFDFVDGLAENTVSQSQRAITSLRPERLNVAESVESAIARYWRAWSRQARPGSST